MEKYRCRHAAHGFQQVPGLHFKVKHAPAVSGASLRMLMAKAAMDSREMKHLDVEQAFVQATADEEIHIELSEEYEGGWLTG